MYISTRYCGGTFLASIHADASKAALYSGSATESEAAAARNVVRKFFGEAPAESLSPLQSNEESLKLSALFPNVHTPRKFWRFDPYRKTTMKQPNQKEQSLALATVNKEQGRPAPVKLTTVALTKHAKAITSHGACALAHQILAGLEVKKLHEAMAPKPGAKAKGDAGPTFEQILHEATGRSKATCWRWMTLAEDFAAADAGLRKAITSGKGDKILTYLQKATEGKTASALQEELAKLLPEPVPDALPPVPTTARKAPKDEEESPGEIAATMASEKWRGLGAELVAATTAEEYRRLPDAVLGNVLDTLAETKAALEAELKERKERLAKLGVAKKGDRRHE